MLPLFFWVIRWGTRFPSPVSSTGPTRSMVTNNVRTVFQETSGKWQCPHTRAHSFSRVCGRRALLGARPIHRGFGRVRAVVAGLGWGGVDKLRADSCPLINGPSCELYTKKRKPLSHSVTGQSGHVFYTVSQQCESAHSRLGPLGRILGHRSERTSPLLNVVCSSDRGRSSPTRRVSRSAAGLPSV